MTVAPTIETQRLRLRAHVEGDFAPYADMFASERSRHMHGPLDRRQAWFAFCGDVAQWSLMGHGAWAVERREDQALIGQVALNKPPHFPELELGWVLFDGFEGKGYATEAAMAARDYAYAELGEESVVSYVTPDNTRSIAVAERLGAMRDDAAPRPDGEGADEVLVFRHPSADALMDGGMEAYA
ncbi:GNAT family N-acetyltransferase [Celeribacter litoreus]|uniref:GNAT family N-acetyltransferase n=1 Tax=Celeribacter litoreus TaxID=2876714 RepID=UPI001CC92A28|nr:GNAT family N-acetyltransferase [Celeribacter litoreus]MCA0044477.1 GNAT family N-acetyltransferase [Celeribacter litoreus]